MRKIIVTLSATTVLIGTSLFIGTPTQAETIEELKTKQSEIKDERSEIKKDLSKAEAKVADVLIDLEEINDEIAKLENALKKNKEAMDETEDNIDALEEDINGLENDIAELEEQIDTRTEILKERISSYQKNGGNIDLLDVVFGSKDFGDLISRISAVTTITKSDQQLIDQQEADKATVEEQKGEVEEKLEEQNDLKDELKDILETVKQQQKDSKTRKKEYKKQEKELKDLVKELEVEDSTLAELERTVSSEIQSIREAEELQTLATTTESNSSNTSSSNKTKDSKKQNDGNINIPQGTGGEAAIQAGMTQTNKNIPYTFGGKTPAGFDCSGFVSWAYGQAGQSLPSSTSELVEVGKKISLSQAKRGDLVFFDTYKTNGHVGIYLGNGQFLGSQSSTGVAVASMNNSYWKPKFNHVRRIN